MRTFSLLVVILCLSVTLAWGKRTHGNYQDSFRNFTQRYRKSFSSDEFQARFSVFKNNLDKIDEHNDRAAGYTLAINEFGALTSEEFIHYYTGLTPTNDTDLSANDTDSAVNETETHDLNARGLSVDWRTRGAVGPVKNQGQCGSCYSFSSAAALEALHFMRTGNFMTFSEQQIVDCSRSYGNLGCNGGTMDWSFSYVQNNGIESMSDYPYTGRVDACRHNPAKSKFRNTGYRQVTRNSDSALTAAVNQQPISVGVQADQAVWQFYSSGVVMANQCGTSINHGVLLVGYGTQNNIPVWLVRNSWGPNWGQGGYIYLQKNSGTPTGTCGILAMTSYPTA